MRAFSCRPMANSGECPEFESLFFHPVPSLRTTQPTVVH